MTCFDLNFTHFADEYRPLAPDMMVFCSYYDGNYMRNYWASRTRAGTFTLYSADPALPVDDVVKEFGMETWREYYDRTLKLKSAIH